MIEKLIRTNTCEKTEKMEHQASVENNNNSKIMLFIFEFASLKGK